MQVVDTPSSGIEIVPDDNDSQELLAIARHHLPEWLRLFAKKNADYGSGSAFELGERGQYSDIHRKMIKLKRSMWDGEELGFEGQAEVISDLIGHLFLTLHMMQLKEDAQRIYAYNEDDAAVDAFFRMVGGDPVVARKMAANLTPPFGELVKKRAKKMLAEEEAEAESARLIIEHKERVVSNMDAAQLRLYSAGLLASDGTPRLLSRSQLMNMADGAEREGRKDDLGAIKSAIVDSFQSEEFGASDQAQHVATYPRRDDDPVHPQD